MQIKMRNIFKLLEYILLVSFFHFGISTPLSAQKIWSGTGFALNNGYLVTNWHVVEGAQTIHIYGIRGDFTKKYIADVVAKDKINDLAILKISGKDFPGFGTVPYKIRTSTAEVAEEIFALGFPMTDIMGDELKYTDGRISSLSGFDGDVSTYQISAPVQPGNSGGPLFDDNGNVIGIVCAKMNNMIAQNVNYAVKASYLKNLVETMQVVNVLPSNSQMGNYPRRQDKVKTIRNFVFYIQCYDKKMSFDDITNRPSYINVLPTSLTFSEKQESKTLTISTNAPSWEVSSKPDWCTVTNKTATTVTINVSKNDSYEDRRGTIVLETNDGEKVSVSVSQFGKKGELNGLEWVDLGLPSGTKWKDKNEADGLYTYDEALRRFGDKLPTKNQFKELKDYCIWTWVGSGYNVVGPSGKSIFMPAAGYRDCYGDVDYIGTRGHYWTSSPTQNDSYCAWYLYFLNSGKVDVAERLRCTGRSVRLVCNEKE